MLDRPPPTDAHTMAYQSGGALLAIMKTHYLHLSAFTCDACGGPVVAGSFATREAEIQRETDIREIGSVCLSCKKQYTSLPISGRVRHMAPLDWEPPPVAGKKKIVNAEPASVVKHYVQ